MFQLAKMNEFQNKFVEQTLALLLSVIHDYVQLAISGYNIDIGYAVIATKFLWQGLRSNKHIRDAFLFDDSAHVEFLVSILFDIAYAKMIHQWILRGGFGSGRVSLYLSPSAMPELDNVLASLLIKLLEERIQKHKVYPFFGRIMTAFPIRKVKKDQQSHDQKRLIQLYSVKMVCALLQRLQALTDKKLLLGNLMFASNVLYLIEICSSSLQNNFAFNLLPRKATNEKKKAKPSRRRTQGTKKTENNEVDSPPVSPRPQTSLTVDRPSLRKERRHSFSGNSIELGQLRVKAMAIKTPPSTESFPATHTKVMRDASLVLNSDTKQNTLRSESITHHSNISNSSFLEQIPLPFKIMRRFLYILQVCKSALDDRMITDQRKSKVDERGSSQNDLERLYHTCRKTVQSILIFFIHKSSELPNNHRHLEKLLPLVIEYQQVLFFTDVSESDFFFVGLMHVLTKLLTNVARYGDKTSSSHTKERLVQHCLNVWDCVLMYQSHFLNRYLNKEPELNEKLRLIVTKRSLFLQWLRKSGLSKAQTTLEAIFGKLWNDRHLNEINLLREKFEKDRSQSKIQHENLLLYEGKIKSVPLHIRHGNANASGRIKELQSIEYARQLARQQQFYYRDLFCRNKGFELIVLKLRIQSALWQQWTNLPWDEAWCVDFVEGPHRMRKLLKRHTKFIRTYKANRKQFLELLQKLESMQRFMKEYYSVHDTYYRQQTRQKAQKQKLHALTTPNLKKKSSSNLQSLSDDGQNKTSLSQPSGDDEDISVEKSLGSSLAEQESAESNDCKSTDETGDEENEELPSPQQSSLDNDHDKERDTISVRAQRSKSSFQRNGSKSASNLKSRMVKPKVQLPERTTNLSKDESNEDTNGGSGLSPITPPPLLSSQIYRDEEDEANDESKFEMALRLSNPNTPAGSTITQKNLSPYEDSPTHDKTDLKLRENKDKTVSKRAKIVKKKARQDEEEEEDDEEEDEEDEDEEDNRDEEEEQRGYQPDDNGSEDNKWMEESSYNDVVESEEKQMHNINYALGEEIPLLESQAKEITQFHLRKNDSTLGIVDRMSRVLGPGDVFDRKHIYNCSTISGLNEDHGIVLLCRTAMYFFYRIRIVVETGELKEIEPNLRHQVAFTTSFEMTDPELGPLLTVKKIRSMADNTSSYKNNSKLGRDDEKQRGVPSAKHKNVGSLQAKSTEPDNHTELSGFEEATENKEPLRFSYDSLRHVYKRQYQLQQIAIEFFLFNGSNFLLIFPKRQLIYKCKKGGKDIYTYANILIFLSLLLDNVLFVFSERDAVFEEVQNAEFFKQRQQHSDQQLEMGNLKTITTGQTSDTLHHIQATQQRTRFQMVAESFGRVADNISVVTKRWENGHMSNFAYLMFLNTLAGRSYNDITQYPVFPWILRDYESEVLNLANPSIYRDLTKPMGAQTEPRASEFKERFETWEDPTGKAPPWHYGSHYSCAAIVLYFLIRLEPFTKFANKKQICCINHRLVISDLSLFVYVYVYVRIALELQGGRFDHADRLFSSIPYSWQLASEHGGMQDVKELIPEFFYLSHFLTNINRFNFHKTEKEIVIDDVVLPRWACGDPERFIRLHREALESPYVSQNLHNWIDLIFGYKQRGDAAVEALNVFYYLTYEGAEDLEAIEDEVEKQGKIAHINNFGQVPVNCNMSIYTPKQLFTKPHPQRKVVNPLINIYSQPDLLQSSDVPTPANSAGVSFLSVLPDMKVVYAFGNELLVPPEFKYSIKWGFPDRSLRVLYKNELATVFEDVVCGEDGQVSSVIISDDGTTLFTGNTTGLINVWRLKTESRGDRRRSAHATLALRSRLYGHSDQITCMSHSKDYRILASGSKDHTVIIWDLNTFQFLHRLEGHVQSISCVAIHNVTGDIFVAAGQVISAWTINGELLAYVITGKSIYHSVSSMSVTNLRDWQPSQCCTLITGHKDGSLRFWSLLIPNGAKEVLDQKQVIKPADEDNVTEIDKYFAPKLPSYQKRRMTPNLNLSKYNSKNNVDSKNTSLKQLAGDTTLRFKPMCTKSKKQSKPVTQIHASAFTHQYLWTGDADGKVSQWEIKKGILLSFFATFANVVCVFILQVAEHWVDDKDFTNCPKCNKLFTVIERKHHCRKCGQIFCNSCSTCKAVLPEMGFGEPVRVCDFCWERLKDYDTIVSGSVPSNTQVLEEFP
ncbi:hypothetical protein RFI_12806 [Reticulomyxa filosa]|uniref:Uncharacterized protein n=1 Tax=Reticulomyxa filosa TaxID=46433 RepID=X6NF24_RETFI|nr:hypothetical protein RFI_12806 [Reticulomyxa filosa]|eukprot:ETO24354.1 hypothetical protein RFI_12806 [Reticulomyxa filosa]